jgi:amino acid transporter
VWHRNGSATHFTWTTILPHWDWNEVNFWPQLAFAFTGLELVSAMSEEIRDPRKTLPRAVFGSGVLIALIYIAGTIAVLILLNDAAVDPKSGVFQAITAASVILKIGALGIIAALLVTVGNAGGVGSTVAGIARVPFVVGVDRYLPESFGRIHPRWRTPHISILVQAGISGAILLLSQINETAVGAYQMLVDAAVILYFIPFLYMYAAAIKLAYRPDRESTPGAVLIPGGKAGVWLAGGLGFLVVLLGIVLSLVPPGETQNKFLFETKLVSGTAVAILIGLALYYRGARQKSQASPALSD